MKKTALTITLLLAASAFAALAETPTSPSAPSMPAPAQEWHSRHGHMSEAWKSLTPEEREKVKAARKAVKNNPEVVQAKKAFHATLKTAMLKADPTIAPVLEKLEAAKKEKGQR